MSSLRRYEVYCDGRIPLPSGKTRSCHKTYEPPLDTPSWPTKPSALRRLAAKEGWTHVRSALGSLFDDDYCPDHNPPKDQPDDA